MFLKLVLLFTLSGCAHASPSIKPVGCEFNPQLQEEASAELIRLAKEDQKDRSVNFTDIDWNRVNAADLKRRIHVAKIFAQGCFKNASDYVSAAMIYQHGKTADHYYQAFIWANKAVQLGDEASLKWIAVAVDRYLVEIEHKQLFGTQLSSDSSGRWCLYSVEASFPEELRYKYLSRNLREQIAVTLKSAGSDQSVNNVKECPAALKSSPAGTVIGFW